jgi:hypothetical protein
MADQANGMFTRSDSVCFGGVLRVATSTITALALSLLLNVIAFLRVSGLGIQP